MRFHGDVDDDDCVNEAMTRCLLPGENTQAEGAGGQGAGAGGEQGSAGPAPGGHQYAHLPV